jgi:hypothetical protein
MGRFMYKKENKNKEKVDHAVITGIKGSFNNSYFNQQTLNKVKRN